MMKAGSLLLCLVCLLSCAADVEVRLVLSNVPAETDAVRVTVALNGTPGARPLYFNQRPAATTLAINDFHKDEIGSLLHVDVEALTAGGCVLARGVGDGTVKAGTELKVSLTTSPRPECPGDAVDMSMPPPDQEFTVMVDKVPSGAVALRVSPSLDGKAITLTPNSFSVMAPIRFKLPAGQRGLLSVLVEALDNAAPPCVLGRASNGHVIPSSEPFKVMMMTLARKECGDSVCPGGKFVNEKQKCTTSLGFAACHDGEQTCTRMQNGFLGWSACQPTSPDCPDTGATRPCTVMPNGCGGTETFDRNTGWRSCMANGRCECKDMTKMTCPKKCPNTSAMVDGSQSCVSAGDERYWGTCNADLNNINCHEIKLRAGNLDANAALWAMDTGDPNPFWSVNTGTIPLYGDIILSQSSYVRALPFVMGTGSQRFVIKFGNANCGWASGWWELWIDGVKVEDRTRPGVTLGHCGVHYRMEFTVNFKTGTYTAGPFNDVCFWPTDCAY